MDSSGGLWPADSSQTDDVMSTDDDSSQRPSLLIQQPAPLQIPGAFHPFTPMQTPMPSPAPSPAPVYPSTPATVNVHSDSPALDKPLPSYGIPSPVPTQQHSPAFSFGTVAAPDIASSQSLKTPSRPSSAVSHHHPALSRHRNSVTTQRRPSSSQPKRRASNELIDEDISSISRPNSSVKETKLKARLVPQRDLQKEEAFDKLMKETEAFRRQNEMQTGVAGHRMEVLETKEVETAERSNAYQREVEWMKQQMSIAEKNMAAREIVMNQEYQRQLEMMKQKFDEAMLTEIQTMKSNFELTSLKMLQDQMADMRNTAVEAATAAEEAQKRAELAEKALADERTRMAAEIAGYERRLKDEDSAQPKQMDIDDRDARTTHPVFSRQASKPFFATPLAVDKGKGRLGAPQTPVSALRPRSDFDDDVIELTSDDDDDTIKMKVVTPRRSTQPIAGTPSTPASRAAPIPNKRSSYGKPAKGLPATPQRQGVARATVQTPVSLTLDEFTRLDTKDQLQNIFMALNTPTRQTPFPRPRAPKSGFKDPNRPTPKEDGRNEQLEWVRKQMNEFIGIKQTKEIRLIDDFFNEESQLMKQIFQYEMSGGDDRYAPDLSPMRFNFENMRGAWNKKVYELFYDYAISMKFGGGNMTPDDDEALEDMFYRRIERMQEVIALHRVRPGEDEDSAQARAQAREMDVMRMARRNTRRIDLFHARADRILQGLPSHDFIMANIENLDEETRKWMSTSEMHQQLGPEGMSSDDSEADENGRYVRKMEWRSPEVIERYALVDSLRRSMTKWGTLKRGCKPQERKREERAPGSSRPAPTGKPINFYDPAWYNKLTPLEKRDLKAETAMEFLA